MIRVLAIVLLSAAVGVGLAAPVPKDVKKDDAIDLRKFHDRVTAAVKANKWADADTRDAEELVADLLKKMSKAAEVEERKSPVSGWKDLDVLSPDKVNVVVRKALVVGEDVSATSAQDCVIIASGNVRFTSITNCVVIAKQIRCTAGRASVLVADEYASATSFSGAQGGECVVVSGERIRATSATGGLLLIARPGTGKPPADDLRGQREDAPIITTLARGVRILGVDNLPRFADKQSQAIPLKAAIVK